jgi:hypothetical protein
MNTTMTMNPNYLADKSSPGTDSEEAAHPKPCRTASNPWRTFAIFVLFVLGLFLAVRVAVAVTELHTALDSLSKGMEYLRADGRVTNF